MDDTDLFNLRDGNSISEIKSLVKRLVGDKWLAPSRQDRDKFTLGARVYLELIAFLRDLDMKKCAICQSEMLQGVPCGKDTCATTIVHDACMRRYEEKGLRFKCTSCSAVVRRK